MKLGTTHPTAALALALALTASAFAGEPVVERRTVVPELDRPHGEVQLVRDGDGAIVRTLVHSRSVRRVAGAIADKEWANWPEGAPGREDAERFVEALATVAAAVKRSGVADDERRKGFRIEFPPAGSVVISGASVGVDERGLRMIAPVEPRVALDVSDAYLQRNRVLIVADAFGVDEATAAAWLQAGP